jgi:hypothetical protein
MHHRWRQTDKGKAIDRASVSRYDRSKKEKASKKARVSHYNRREKGKASKKARVSHYNRKEKGKASKKAHEKINRERRWQHRSKKQHSLYNDIVEDFAAQLLATSGSPSQGITARKNINKRLDLAKIISLPAVKWTTCSKTERPWQSCMMKGGRIQH